MRGQVLLRPLNLFAERVVDEADVGPEGADCGVDEMYIDAGRSGTGGRRQHAQTWHLLLNTNKNIHIEWVQNDRIV